MQRIHQLKGFKAGRQHQGIINYFQTIPDIPIYDIDGNYATVVREKLYQSQSYSLAMMDDILLNRQN